MDQDTRNQIASLQGQLALLRSALNASGPLEAQATVTRLATTVEALVAWAQTVDPPFTPPEGG
jgi:hypothetical protein